MRGGLARAGGFAGALGRLRSWAKSEAAAREGENNYFPNFLISRKFQISIFKYPFEQEIASFENVPKMKVD